MAEVAAGQLALHVAHDLAAFGLVGGWRVCPAATRAETRDPPLHKQGERIGVGIGREGAVKRNAPTLLMPVLTGYSWPSAHAG
jgi:hypothetical protein